MPAPGFENMNATKDFGFNDFFKFAQIVTAGTTDDTTANATDILRNVMVQYNLPAELQNTVPYACLWYFWGKGFR